MSHCGEREHAAVSSSGAPEAEVVPSEPQVLSDIILDLIEEWYDNQDLFEKTYRTVLGRIHLLHGDYVRRVDVWRLRFEELERLEQETVLIKRESVDTALLVMGTCLQNIRHPETRRRRRQRFVDGC